MQPKKSKPAIRKSGVLLAAGMLMIMPVTFGCKDDEAPKLAVVSSPKVVEKKADAQKESEKKPGTEESKREYSYNPNGKIDPFLPLVTLSQTPEMPTAEKKEKKEVPLTPLQKLNVDDFNLVAVIVSDNQLKALLEDPAVNGFIVKEGMLIGKNGGIIKKILPNSMLVEEQTTDDQGKKEMKIRTITLKKKSI